MKEGFVQPRTLQNCKLHKENPWDILGSTSRGGVQDDLKKHSAA